MPVTPKRSLEQRMDALTVANRVRTYRAELKRQIKSRNVSVIDVLLDPPDELDTMKIFDLLLATPKLGKVKVNLLLHKCRISPSKTVGGMSIRQRSELVSMMRR